MTDGNGQQAWATLLTREDYLPGVRVLWRSLQDVGTAYPLVVLVTDGVSPGARELLLADGCEVLEVDRIDPPAGTSDDDGYLFEQFSEVWTKLRAWSLPHERVVLLDADMMVTQGLDALMTMPLPDAASRPATPAGAIPSTTRTTPPTGCRRGAGSPTGAAPASCRPTSTCTSTPGWSC